MHGSKVLEPQAATRYLTVRLSDCDMQASSFEPTPGPVPQRYRQPETRESKDLPSKKASSRQASEGPDWLSASILKDLMKSLKLKRSKAGSKVPRTTLSKENKAGSQHKIERNYSQLYHDRVKAAKPKAGVPRQSSPNHPTDHQIFIKIFMHAKNNEREANGKYSALAKKLASSKQSKDKRLGSPEARMSKARDLISTKTSFKSKAMLAQISKPESRLSLIGSRSSGEAKSATDSRSRSNGLTLRTVSSRAHIWKAEVMHRRGKGDLGSRGSSRDQSLLQTTSKVSLAIQSKNKQESRPARGSFVADKGSSSYKQLFKAKAIRKPMTASALVSPSPGHSREMTTAFAGKCVNLSTYNKNHHKAPTRAKK